MRNFTPEEKELIVNTEITRDCFEMESFKDLSWFDNEIKVDWDDYKLNDTVTTWGNLTYFLDQLRREYRKTKDERYFTELVRLLPNSYKVVNLCAEQEKKDFCKYKHNVSGKKVSVSSIGTTSAAFPCYEVYSCDKCDCFKM